MQAAQWWKPNKENKPVVCGHRGVPDHFAENTLAGFRLATELGAQALEFDVRPTSDGHLVIHHDAVTKKGIDIATARLDELPDTIPTLEQVYRLACELEVGLDIELKASRIGIALRDYCDLFLIWLQTVPQRIRKTFIVTSFDAELLAMVARSGSVATGLLYHDRSHRWARGECEEHGHQAVVPWVGLLNVESVRRAHDQGLAVMTWTVNREPAFTTAVRSGVDVVIGDDAAQLDEWRDTIDGIS